MEPVMYFIVNADLIKQMGPGKIAAQVAHAAIDAYTHMPKDALYQEWKHSGHAKVVLKAPEHVMNELHDKYRKRCCPVHDAGRTRIVADSFTVLGWHVMRKDELKELTELKLL